MNGVLRSQGTATQALLDSFNNPVAIGGVGGTSAFPGDLDEVAIYPLALSCGTTTLNVSCTGGSQIGTHYVRGLDAGITASESSAATHVLAATDATTTATPNPAVVWYQPAQNGTFTVTSAATDTIDGTTRGAATSVSSVLFQTASLLAGLSSGGTDSSAPYTGAYTWSASLSGDQLVNVTVSNNNSLSAVNQYQLKTDSSAPSGGSISYTDGNNTTGSIALTLVNGTDGAGSGVDAASPILERASATLTNGTCGGFGAFASIGVAATDASVTNANCCKYQYKVSDNVGNQTMYTSANVVKVDTVNPANGLALSSITPAGSASLSGTTVFYRGSGGGSGGSFTVTNTVTDNGFGPVFSTFDSLDGTTTGWTFTGSTVSTPSGGPYVSTAVAWAEGATTSPTLANGTAVTSFPWATPFEIVFAGMTADFVPSRSSDGGLTYSGIPLIPGPTLPVGYVDGYWFDATTGKLHILTTHLTIFAVQRDTQAPSAPRSPTGVIAGDGLTLRWEPASDNSGAIAHYYLFINGERIQTFGGVTFASTPTPVGKDVDVVLVNGPAVRVGSSLNLPAKATVQSVRKGPDVYDVSGT